MNDLKNRAIDAWKARFVRKTETTSWGLSVLLHVSIALLLFSFVTCSVPIDDDEKQHNDTTMVEVEWGGSGGMPGIEDAPETLKPMGERSGGNPNDDPTKRNRSADDQTKSQRDRGPQTTDGPQLPEDDEGTERNGAEEEGPSEQGKSNNPGPNNSDSPHGESDGTGDRTASGSGGLSVGSGNLGSRGWLVSPKSAAAGSAPAEVGTATVTVTLTVMYDGSVRVGGASGGTPAMKAQARDLAGRARANAVEVGSPPVKVTATYRYTAN